LFPADAWANEFSMKGAFLLKNKGLIEKWGHGQMSIRADRRVRPSRNMYFPGGIL